MYYEKHINKLLEDLSKKYGLPRNVVEGIVMAQFKKLKKVITDEDHKSIQLIHLGKFQISEKRINNLNKEK
jgi:nucleoid DNA-binding protein